MLASPKHTTPTIIAATLLAMIVGGCGADTSRTTHADGQGDLRTHSGEVFVGMQPPRGHKTWSGTFGAILLCSQDGKKVSIDAIRSSGSVSPASISYSIRNVPSNDGQLTPVGSAFGSAPDFAEPYADSPPRGGDFLPKVAGAEVIQRCGRKLNMKHGFTELVISMTSGPGGAVTDRQFLDYTVDGKRYTLELRETLVMCGTRSEVRELMGPCKSISR